ncbi:hypothetical protein [Agromyces rhizosphaerae]|uniref:hypothetical protein n=1 Tax=Agromyces rhizosphaerae TaxID=88374 RepID=UPI002492E483|nr:hypothetical protein [Agromyces rhizosphaerae]
MSAPRHAAAPDEPSKPAYVLEIRVHGIANAPPAVMLESEPDEITRRLGDDLGSFWSRKDDDNDTVDPKTGIASTEAYSWGRLARTGGTAIAAIGRVFVHLGWLFVLPFGLTNIAYWTRRIPLPDSANEEKWSGGRGAKTLRLFALTLTLIYMAAFMSVAVDLIGVQCFRGEQVCAALPAIFDGLLGLDRAARAALFSLGPIAAMALIYIVSRRGRVNYESNVAQFSDTFMAGEERRRPLLATHGFWSMARVTSTSEQLHFAASIGLVLMLLGWDAAFAGDRTACGADCATSLFASGPVFPVVVGAGLLIVAFSAVLVVAATSPKSQIHAARARRSATAMLVVAAVLYIAYVGVMIGTTWVREPEAADGTPFLGLIAAPNALAVAALGVAYAGAGWTRGVPKGISFTLLLGALALLLASELADPLGYADTRLAGITLDWLLLGTAVACVVAYFLVVWARRRWTDTRFVAWAGMGPAVGMLLALLTSMVISSLLVLGVNSWLGTSTDAGETEFIWRTPPEPGSTPLDAPSAYERYSVVIAAIALLVLILGGASAIGALTRRTQFTVPSLGSEPDQDGGEANLLGIADPAADYAEQEAQDVLVGRARRIVSARNQATIVHRGEGLLGVIAVLAAVGFLPLTSSLAFQTIRDLVPDEAEIGIRDAAVAILAAVAIAAVAAVAARAASHTERPLALLWDIMCFFPRAGHPFAPPCYGERAVPELTGRTCRWLRRDYRGRTGVVIAAHSMGTVIAAASVLALSNERVSPERGPLQTLPHPEAGDDDACAADRVALLSYGTQLRAYFSRFFPSVLGPRVLGVPGCRAPSLWSPDPWAAQVRHEWPTRFPDSRTHGTDPFAQDGTDETLARVLGYDGDPATPPRWRSLWRRTDYLGFPAYGYNAEGNPVDRGATESAPDRYIWAVAKHNDYLPTKQYLRARDELVSALQAAATPQDATAPTDPAGGPAEAGA